MTLEPNSTGDGARLDRRRQQAIDELLKAVGEGQLSFDAYCDRADAVRDSVTEADLDAALDGVRRDVPTDRVPSGGSTSNFFSLFGDVQRSGPWSVAADTRMYTVFGDLTLDLRDAYLTSDVVEINCNALFGDLRVVVPDGVEVRTEGFTLFGDTRADLHGRRQPETPRVVVRYNSLFGDCRIASESSGERWFKRWLKKHPGQRRPLE